MGYLAKQARVNKHNSFGLGFSARSPHVDTCKGCASRRHTRDCHGLCPFSLRSAFTMHVEAGHSAVPEEGPKDLRCPLCLYHTKYKRNMIDHIVLHRGNLQTGSGVLGPAGRWRCSILRMLPVDRSSIALFPGLCSSRLESQ